MKKQPIETSATARRIMSILVDEYQPMTRHQLAKRMHKSYLMRYDIKVLTRLVSLGLVNQIRMNRWQYFQQLAGETIRRPTDYKGRNIQFAARMFCYKATPTGSRWIKQINADQLNRLQKERDEMLSQRSQTYDDLFNDEGILVQDVSLWVKIKEKFWPF